jgi:hypothetical protein
MYNLFDDFDLDIQKVTTDFYAFSNSLNCTGDSQCQCGPTFASMCVVITCGCPAPPPLSHGCQPVRPTENSCGGAQICLLGIGL